MAGKRSKPFVIIADARKNRVMELICEGKSLTEVARIMKVSVARISQIASEKRAEWAAKNEVVVGDHIQVQLARLHRTFQQADRTYQRSLQDARKVVTSRSENGENETETVEGQAGDTAALGIKLRCVEMALKLLNAFPKEEKGTSVIINQWPWADMANPIPSVEMLEQTPSSEVEARIEAELKSQIPPNNNGNGNGHV